MSSSNTVSHKRVKWIIVPAAGVGRRMGGAVPKQYLSLAGQNVLTVTLTCLHDAWPSARLLLCLSKQDEHFDESMVPAGMQWQRVLGGTERADSVWQGLQALKDKAMAQDWVAVHDVARPCVRVNELHLLEHELGDDPVGGLLATPVSDTMKRAYRGQCQVKCTERRTDLWHALTPQLFRYEVLYQAMAAALNGEEIADTITDEASAVESLGLSPRLVMGRRDNLKITHPEDLPLAEQILAAQRYSSK